MSSMLICSRFPSPDEENLQMGGKFKKDVMRLIKKGSKEFGPGGVGVGTQDKIYNLGKKAMKGRGEESDQEGAGRSRLSAHFAKK